LFTNAFKCGKKEQLRIGSKFNANIGSNMHANLHRDTGTKNNGSEIAETS